MMRTPSALLSSAAVHKPPLRLVRGVVTVVMVVVVVPPVEALVRRGLV